MQTAEAAVILANFMKQTWPWKNLCCELLAVISATGILSASLFTNKMDSDLEKMLIFFVCVCLFCFTVMIAGLGCNFSPVMFLMQEMIEFASKIQLEQSCDLIWGAMKYFINITEPAWYLNAGKTQWLFILASTMV